MIESSTGRVYSVLRLTREAAPRTAALLLVCYLTLTLAAGAPLRGHLWDAGQHATPHQWRLHTQLAERGANAHHAEYAHDVYHASHINPPALTQPRWTAERLRAEASVTEGAAASGGAWTAGVSHCGLSTASHLPWRIPVLMHRRAPTLLPPSSIFTDLPSRPPQRPF